MSTKNRPVLEQVNNDLSYLVDFCREKGLSDAEIARICEPLTAPLKREKFYKRLRLFAISTVVLIVGYYSIQSSETIAWHVSAIGRIAMIKMLRFWDWTKLKNEKCLMQKFWIEGNDSGPVFDCVLCESIDKIRVESKIDAGYLSKHYIELHKPVIVLDALYDWPIFKNPELVSKDPVFLQSVPCKLSSNLKQGLMTVKEILTKLEEFDEYFVHFQNCEFDVVKTFRSITPRLAFLLAHISPVQYNWLLMSQNYNVTNYKPIELKEPITVVAQVCGSNLFELTPRGNCKHECPMVNIELTKGETLIFTSLWDLAYKPYGDAKNVAVILEMH